MIRGRVSEEGIPTIELEVATQRFTAIIDTGFNGELELPESLLPHINSESVGRVTSLLAANQRIEEEVFLVDFPFDGVLVRAQATFVAGDEILIGTRLLIGHLLQIDFPSKAVLLDRR